MSENSVFQEAVRQRMAERLTALYGAQRAQRTLKRLLELIGAPSLAARTHLPLSERDVVLIAYGDHLSRAGETPLATLHRTLKPIAAPEINSLHLLPFYPYSSDDGFSVIDYDAVDARLGGWEDIRALGQDFRLMFDGVFNHISARSAWFQGFLRGESPYRDYFIVADPNADLSQVTRPRALPLLTAFPTPQGTKHVWTTFSDDQIDLNFANPDVLLDVLRVLLFYVGQGARLIRLDAIAFLWKRIGTSCIHLPETHLIVQLMRDVLDWVAPSVILITETNVPHPENMAYFGDGRNEAQMVYQFPLPPLALHTFRTGDSTALTRWAGTLARVSDQTTFFNFTASHDGIGMRPTTGLLTAAEMVGLARLAEAHGGHVSYKSNSDGSQSPYELNLTYFDAITNPQASADQPETAVARFLCSQAIMLAFMGVPGIYLPSLFGARNDQKSVAETGRYRSINREKFDADALLSQLADPQTIAAQVYSGYLKLIRIRSGEAAFHPLGGQSALDLGPSVFALERLSPDGQRRVLALHNVTGAQITVQLPPDRGQGWHDLLSSRGYSDSVIALSSYQIAWLVKA